MSAKCQALHDQSKTDAPSASRPIQSGDVDHVDQSIGEEITSYFVRTEALLAQTKRIKQECHESHFMGALTAKQRQAMSVLQERSVVKFLDTLIHQTETEHAVTAKQVDFYRSIVNMEVTDAFLDEQEAWFRVAHKFAIAYATLLLRLKSRTDEFVRSNQAAEVERIAAVGRFGELLAA